MSIADEIDAQLLARGHYWSHARYPYAATHTAPGHATLAAYFNLDNGTGKIRGIWGQGNLGAMAQFRGWMESVKDLGVEYVGPRSVTSTDHVGFDAAGAEIARGLTRYDAADAAKIKGLKSAEIENALGYAAGPALVHADDLVLR